ncbi:aminoacyl-tRNA hydrolase [Candidatus Parcubacteria bacterium]|nr:aminoacyl-tRNA hydrolase [Candidatus Parcubacteria bacterium]
MSLFVRRESSDEAPLYKTVATSRLYNNAQGSELLLIVGLGNIGKEYVGTRHNIGFEIVEHFAKKQNFESWANKKDLHSQQAIGNVGNKKVILCKPTTFMNESGRAVQAVQHFYKIDNANTIVVHDELDIVFGQIRTRIGGGAAGHNGIKSIIANIGEGFGRVRVGIGPKSAGQQTEQVDSSDFVLSRFSKTQEKHLPLLLQEANAILSEHCFSNDPLPAETRSFII